MDWTSQHPKLPYDSELHLNQSSAPPNLHDYTNEPFRFSSLRDPGLFVQGRKGSMCGGRDPEGIYGLTGGPSEVKDPIQVTIPRV